mmetsp:Transcript_10598/g.15952  ORF Transcript_10598/g.15952 Transcript_10598/m.15952 type:complete len:208 (-) Transcript_10598:1064-1687(-)
MIVNGDSQVFNPRLEFPHLLFLIKLESQLESRDENIELIRGAVVGHPHEVKVHLLPEFEGVVHLGLGDKDHQVVKEDDLHLLGRGGKMVFVGLKFGLPSDSLLCDGHDGIANKTTMGLKERGETSCFGGNGCQLTNFGGLSHAVIDFDGDSLHVLECFGEVGLITMIVRSILVQIFQQQVVTRDTLDRHNQQMFEIHTNFALDLVTH